MKKNVLLQVAEQQNKMEKIKLNNPNVLLKKGLKFFYALAAFLFFETASYAQLSVPNVTACPGQTVTFTASWPNTGNITYTIIPPVGTQTITSNPNFVVSSAGTIPVTYTIIAMGTSATGIVTETVTPLLNIIVPPALTISNALTYACLNTAVTFTATTGAPSYTITGPGTSFNTANNIITIPNVNSSYSGEYTVSATISGCARKGVATLSVEPNSPFAVSSPTSVCRFGSVQLTSSILNGTGYSWSVPSTSQLGPTISGQNPQLTNLQSSDGGVYKVTAYVNYGNKNCPHTATTAITVVQTGGISVSASPGTTVCQGASFNLIASVATATPQGYAWTGPSNFIASSASPVLGNVSPLQSGEYTITASFVGGNITCYRESKITLSVVATSVPSLSVPQNICQGDDASLSAGAPGAMTYSWIGVNNFSSPLQSPTLNSVTPNASGIYQVYTKFSLGSVSCITSNSAVLNVIPINSISVIPPTPVCIPDNGFLTASAIGASSYTWVGPNNFFYSSVANPNAVVYAPTQNSSGVYTVTAGFSGAGLTCYNSNTVYLLVKPLLIFTLPQYVDVCYNEDVHVDGPAGATSYSWTSSTSFTSNTQDLDITSIQPDGTGSYTLTVSLDGCYTSDVVNINVRKRIEFSSILVPERVVCPGDTIVANVQVENCSTCAYVWSPNNMITPPSGSGNVTITPWGTTNYNITVHDQACAHYSITQSFKATVIEVPEPELTLDNLEGCQPLLLQVNTKMKRGDAMWTDYNFGGELVRIIGNGDTSFVQVMNTPGINKITYTTRGAYSNDLLCNGHYEYMYDVKVLPKSGSDIHWIPQSPTITDEITFIADSKVEISNYSWTFAGPGIMEPDTASTGASTRRTFETSGTYPFMLISKTTDGCIDTTIKYLRVSDDFNVFIPNTFTPNGDGINDIFYPVITGIEDKGYNMSIYDRNGLLIYSTTKLSEGWDGTLKGNIAPNDAYTYKITLTGLREGKKEYTGWVSITR